MRRQFEMTKGKFLRELELWLEPATKERFAGRCPTCSGVRHVSATDAPKGRGGQAGTIATCPPSWAGGREVRGNSRLITYRCLVFSITLPRLSVC